MTASTTAVHRSCALIASTADRRALLAALKRHADAARYDELKAPAVAAQFDQHLEAVLRELER